MGLNVCACASEKGRPFTPCCPHPFSPPQSSPGAFQPHLASLVGNPPTAAGGSPVAAGGPAPSGTSFSAGGGLCACLGSKDWQTRRVRLGGWGRLTVGRDLTGVTEISCLCITGQCCCFDRAACKRVATCGCYVAAAQAAADTVRCAVKVLGPLLEGEGGWQPGKTQALM